jgi:hypothetical protein
VKVTKGGAKTGIHDPTNLKKALAAAAPKARALWSDITPNAHRDWIHWITSAK